MIGISNFLLRVQRGLVYRVKLIQAWFVASVLDRRDGSKAVRLSAGERDLLGKLERDGFVKLDLFAPEDIDAFAGAVKCTFDAAQTRNPKVVGQNIKHPFLFSSFPQKALAHDTVKNLVRAYIGTDATFDFSQIFRIPEVTDNETLSGLWHHDRVGKRLKLFVYLHDVGENDRVTHYAVGSHLRRHLRWSHRGSRYADEWVNKRFPVARLSGTKGQAYLFDTNGIHRAVWEANSTSRDVLYFEWSSFAKSRILRRLGYHIGVCREILPDGLPAGEALARPELIRREGGVRVYGRSAPDFVFVYDPAAPGRPA